MKNSQVILLDSSISTSKYKNNIIGKLVTMAFLLVGLLSVKIVF